DRPARWPVTITALGKDAGVESVTLSDGTLSLEKQGAPAVRLTGLSGDLAVSTTPFINQWLYHWPRTLNAFATECDFEHVIPGHGAVQKGKQRFTQFADYLEDLMNTVQMRRRGGKTAADLKKEITPETLVSLKGGYAAYLGEQILRYRLLPGVKNADDALRVSLQGNIDQVYNVLGQL
ncbi:MAG: hypothetical protein K2Q23_17635, partial [Bryobacteraceae bacterium]|nr:hypothetical protein [Bryobacteraceae bacterium]